MADKPSRAFVVYGDGHASLVSPSHAHLHSFASRAACGFLSLRIPPPDESENDRVVRELAQLVDAYDFWKVKNGKHGERGAKIDLNESSAPTIPERFMGLRAAIITDSPSVRSFAGNLGFSVLQIQELVNASTDELCQEAPDDLAIFSELMRLLGFSAGNILEKSEFDLVFLHIGTSEKSKNQKGKIIPKTNVDWLNKLVGQIIQATLPGSDIARRLHVSIVLSYGTVSESKNNCSFSLNSAESDSDLSLLRPRQSYTVKGGHTLDDIRHHHPMLIAQCQEGVTRKDMATEFSFQDFWEHGGNLAILADQFLHEVAFKLWKAPKYGA